MDCPLWFKMGVLWCVVFKVQKPDQISLCWSQISVFSSFFSSSRRISVLLSKLLFIVIIKMSFLFWGRKLAVVYVGWTLASRLSSHHKNHRQAARYSIAFWRSPLSLLLIPATRNKCSLIYFQTCLAHKTASVLYRRYGDFQ